MRPLTWTALALPLCIAAAAPLTSPHPWRTADQAGRAAFSHSEFDHAAQTFEQPDWRGAALYRAGNFEVAASYLAGVTGPRASYNRGNALVFLGHYEQAVEAYDQALALRPDWVAASENRAIAASRIREEQVGRGTDGMLGADEIVFDETPGSAGQTIEATGGDELADDELRALWLRGVETRPGDFLRTKFAYQQAVGDAENR